MGPTRDPDNGAGMTVTILTIAGSFGYRSSRCAQTTMEPIIYTNYAKCVPILYGTPYHILEAFNRVS